MRCDCIARSVSSQGNRLKFHLFSLSEAVELSYATTRDDHVPRMVWYESQVCSCRRCTLLLCRAIARWIDQSIDLREIMSLLTYFKASQGHDLMAPAVLLCIPVSCHCSSLTSPIPSCAFHLFLALQPLKCLLFLSLSLSFFHSIPPSLILIKDKKRHLLLMTLLMKRGPLLSGTKVSTN